MTSVDKLVKRLNDDFDLNLEASKFRRLRPGYWQRRQGAWSWIITDNSRDYGSQNTVKECLIAKKLTIRNVHGTVEIYPE